MTTILLCWYAFGLVALGQNAIIAKYIDLLDFFMCFTCPPASLIAVYLAYSSPVVLWRKQ